jgi:hypothetical protein
MKLHGITLALALVALVACSAGPSQSSSFPADAYTSITTDSGTYRVEVRTAPSQPPTRGDLELELRVQDPKGAPVDGLALAVVPWMPTHDHGASVVPSVTPLGSGAYHIAHVDLFMPGTWQLRMTLGAGAATDHGIAEIAVQ